MAKVVVIGAGIAGLVASIKLLKKKHQVVLIEKNQRVGGLCTGYTFNGHYIDCCLHWLMGTQEGNSINKVWQETGALGKDVKIISLPTLGSIEYQGTTVTFYRDLDKAEEEWIKISPIDEKAIHTFFTAVKHVGSLMDFVLSNKRKGKVKILDLIKSLPDSAHIIKSMKQSREEYAQNFTHPAIRFAIKNCQTGYNNMFFFFDLYGIFAKGNADVPEGGALYMVQRMKDKFLSMGGKLVLGTEAQEILVKDEKAYLVKTNNGLFDCDFVISSVDPYYTLEKLLNNKYRIKRFEKLKKDIDKNTISSCFNVYITVKGSLKKLDVPTGLNIKPIKVGATTTDFMLVRPYYFDKEHFVKKGKTVVSLFVDQNQNDYNYFASLSNEEYKKEIDRIIDDMMNAFKERYPEFKEKMEFLVYFDPIRIKHHTNTSYGSIQSFSFTNKNIFYSYNGKIKGLENVFLIGQWNRSIGGTPTALLTATSIVKNIKQKRKFHL